jgi:hypothetical protein
MSGIMKLQISPALAKIEIEFRLKPISYMCYLLPELKLGAICKSRNYYG